MRTIQGPFHEPYDYGSWYEARGNAIPSNPVNGIFKAVSTSKDYCRVFYILFMRKKDTKLFSRKNDEERYYILLQASMPKIEYESLSAVQKCNMSYQGTITAVYEKLDDAKEACNTLIEHYAALKHMFFEKKEEA